MSIASFARYQKRTSRKAADERQDADVAEIIRARRSSAEMSSARESFLEFRRAVGRDDRGNPLAEDAFARLMATTLDECRKGGKHVNVKSPPQLGKSTDARLYLAWLIGNDIQTTTAIISGDDNGAKDACGLVREIVESEAYRAVFPEAIPDAERSNYASAGATDSRRGWRRDGWFLQADGQRKDPTCGAYANTPKREDLSIRTLLADDLITERTANSEAERSRIVNAWSNTWIEGRISKHGGWAMYLQNHRVDGDLGDQLREDSRFCSVFVGVRDDLGGMFVRVWNPPPGFSPMTDPASFDCTEVAPAGNADWEAEFPFPPREGWTREVLEGRNREAFRKLFQLHGAQPEDLVIPSWAERRVIPGTASNILRVREVAGEPFVTETERTRFVSAAAIDISGTKRRGCAFVAGSKFFHEGGMRRAVSHVRRFSRLEDLIEWLDGSYWGSGWRPVKIAVEDNGVQSQIVDMMRATARDRRYEWETRIVPWHTGANKLSAEEGLYSLDPLVASGEYLWPEDEAKRSRDWRGFEDAVARLDRKTIMKRGQTPDDVMAWWILNSTLESLGSVGARPQTQAITRPRSVAGY